MLKKIIYISDLSLPSNKAQAVHIFKLLDNFLQFSDKAILICPNLKKKFKKDFSKNILIYTAIKILKYIIYLKSLLKLIPKETDFWS